MRRLIQYLVIAVAGTALLLRLAAEPAAKAIGGKFGPVILKAANGKVADPVAFVSGRLSEASLLLLVSAILIVAYAGVRHLVRNRPNGWVPLAIGAFVAVNLWVFVATKTCLFWAGLFTGSATATITQFQFKRSLLKEHRAPHQILMVGSSQTQAQVDENVLNEKLAGKAWTTELHFPGSRSLDLLLVLRRLAGEPGHDLVCYLSEYYFYPGLYSTTPPYFASVRDVPLLRKLGLGREMATQPFGMGFLAEMLPLFGAREPLADRILGVALSSLKQAKHDANLETNLVHRAEKWAAPFRLDENAAIQKRAFMAFVEEAAHQRRRLILIEGQVNPILSARIPKELRGDMRKFLREVAGKNPNVLLITDEELPAQPESSYSDLTHVNKEVQNEFSLWLAAYLKDRLPKSVAAAN